MAAAKHLCSGDSACKSCRKRARLLERLATDPGFYKKYWAYRLEWKRKKRRDPEYRTLERDATRDRELKRRRKLLYGFSAELVAALRAASAGACCLCGVVMGRGRGPKSECADHDHATKTPRGLLCRACNSAIGFYEKHQRPAGLRIQQYEAYLADPPARKMHGF